MATNDCYGSAFNEAGFWAKIAQIAHKVGREVVEKALILFYALRDPNVPTKARAVVISALGYLIMPFDAIPDLLPLGFADDFAVIASALAYIAAYVSPETIERAKKQTNVLFGSPPGG